MGGEGVWGGVVGVGGGLINIVVFIWVVIFVCSIINWLLNFWDINVCSVIYVNGGIELFVYV